MKTMSVEEQWSRAMQSVDQPTGESYEHHCRETEAWKEESDSDLWECQWNFQRDLNGGPEEKDHCRQQEVVIMKHFLSC